MSYDPIKLTGDVTGASDTGDVATTLATVNSDAGSYTNASITVNGKGLITAASSGSAGAVSSVANDDGTLTISPTTGSVVASLNLGNANSWTAAQTFEATTTFTYGTVQQIRVVTASGSVTVAVSDNIIVVNKGTGAATTVNLPSSPVTGQVFTIKDGKGDAGTNNITLTPAAGDIDGATTYVMNVNYMSTDVVYNGIQWNVI